MKKLISILLSAILLSTLICAAPFTVSAAVVDSGTTGDCTWTLDDNGTLIISGNGKMGDYEDKYQNGSYITTAPWGVNIKSVVIESGVTNIGVYAFYGCKNLTSVDIPDSVTSIGNFAFHGCTGLTSIDIPESVTSIGQGTFSGCTGLTSITIPDSVTSIGGDAFWYTAWYNNQPDGLIYAGKVAYDYKGTMPAYTSIVIKEGTKGIAGSAFYYCENLTSITIPDSVTSIGWHAFSDCTGLTSITIPDSVTSIGGWAFTDCENLTSVTIGNSVTSIGDDAFENCHGLKSVTIGNSVTSIGSNAFYGTAWYYNQPDGVVYAGKVAYKYKGTMPDNTSIVLKEGTKGIAAEAFYDCKNLTSITIPDSVTSIGYRAFCKCGGLTSVTIPDSVTSIGELAFGYYYSYFYEYYKTDDFTIYGVKGSEAERYADDNEFTFIEIEPELKPVTGDANGDKNIDVLDATDVQKYASGKGDLTAEQISAADVNNDGVVDILDATDIQKFAAGIISEFKKKA